MASLTHSARKEKAKRLQKLVASKVSELTGLPCGKDCPIESRQMGESGVDVRLDNQARVMWPWSCECKNQETWSVPAWVKQAQANCYEGTDWLLVIGKNHTKPVVVLDLDVFFNLLSKLKQSRGRK